MPDLELVTYDWVPEPPRGFVRDLRIRWALEEAGLPYRVRSTPFDDRPPSHLAHQPFNQVPWLVDGDRTLFESGAILHYIGGRAPALMPKDRHEEITQWLFAALNSVEIATMPWGFARFMGRDKAEEPWESMTVPRLKQVDAALQGRDWLAGDFSVADILMADVLRFADRFDGLAECPACRDYLARATARPGFVKAHDDQIAHFEAGDAARAEG